MKGLVYLENLYLKDCKMLRDISPDVPPNIKVLDVSNCTALSPQSLSILLLQEYKEVRGLDVIVPGKCIPAWFCHHRKGKTMSFWIRKDFPEIFVAFVFLGQDEHHVNATRMPSTLELCLSIDDDMVFQTVSSIICFVTSEYHVWLSDLRNHFPKKWLDCKEYLHDGWNHVEVSFRELDFTAEWCGVRVCTTEFKLEDSILFTNPDDSDQNSGLNCDNIRPTKEIKKLNRNLHVSVWLGFFIALGFGFLMHIVLLKMMEYQWQ
ncbi:TMV resistance protein N-like [Quillaja saponaria]|uniref:TMV resistance protein N-like n=1 Tax=Quillaja saponaria TaxID=32244 RepID=A0AAD7Q627_QUISA|nr:TMV resistance protein N-like [Quillaja saponaria]